MRKICVVITARPSYSRIKALLQAISTDVNLELQLVLAASALLDKYGDVSSVIKEDGFTIDANVYNLVEGEPLISCAKTTGLGIIELSTVFSTLKPDFVVTIADRYETIATAIAASYMNIPLIHIQGGEVTGSIDEKVRHAITKLSDYHFVSTKKARENVIRMGEDPERVFLTGCPSIDIAARVVTKDGLDFDPILKYGGVGNDSIPYEDYFVVMQHPVTSEVNEAKAQILETLYAVSGIPYKIYWFWPNVDAGSDDTSKGIRMFRELHNPSNIHFFKNMHPDDFIKLLINCKGIIGNSSVAIRECSFLGVPAVDIGTRQANREKGKNVISVDYNRNEIKAAIEKIGEEEKHERDLLYGDGNAANRIVEYLKIIQPSFTKRLFY